MVSVMAPMSVRHNTASGQVTTPAFDGIVSVPVSRIGASVNASHRLACSARRGPKRKERVNVRWVASKPVITSGAPRHP